MQAGQQLHHYRLIEKIGEGGMGPGAVKYGRGGPFKEGTWQMPLKNTLTSD